MNHDRLTNDTHDVLAAKVAQLELENGQLRAELTLIRHAETPSSRWSQTGEPDPHGTQYDCERRALALGDMTDDELANAVFMYGDKRPSVDDLMRGVLMPIAYLTAAKERIRWLSRQLEAAHTVAARQSSKAGDPTPKGTRHEH